ncbi:hypothetical protein FHW00_002650 [Ochrobactrum sp. P6BSIII]|nr:hypothetical protein [Ochrobactrum sp. P6BSIII]
MIESLLGIKNRLIAEQYLEELKLRHMPTQDHKTNRQWGGKHQPHWPP